MDELARKIHEETGCDGAKLEMATHTIMMLHCDLLGQTAFAQYFEQRMRESYFRLQALI